MSKLRKRAAYTALRKLCMFISKECPVTNVTVRGIKIITTNAIPVAAHTTRPLHLFYDCPYTEAISKAGGVGAWEAANILLMRGCTQEDAISTLAVLRMEKL